MSITPDADAMLRDLNSQLVPADLIERDDLTLATVDISVVMPCLNEEDSVAACVEAALAGIQRSGLTGEVVVCDNGSTDASVACAAGAGARVVHQPQKGYGSAYRKGFEAARGRILVMGDSDGSYDFSQLDRLVAKLDEGYDYVLGSRFAGTILPGAMPWLHRYVGNPALTGLLNLFFGLDASDAHSGMRAFTREAYDRLGVATEGMEFASEIVINAAHAGLRVAEVPITYHPRTGESKLHSFRDGWRHLRFMLLLAPNWLFVLPGTVLFVLGIIGELALLPGPLNLTSQRTLGVHFSLLFTMLAILGYMQLMFGIFTKAYARSRGAVGCTDRLLRFVDRWFSLERGLVFGLAMFLIGACIDAAVLTHWLANHMGHLNALRPVLMSMTLMTLGAQTAFGSFFLSLFQRSTQSRESVASSLG